MQASRLRRKLARLGPDILAGDFDLAIAVRSLRADPDRSLGDALLDQDRVAMQGAVEGGGRPGAVYGRGGRPCGVCGTPIVSRGQGDGNRITYWCPGCQTSPSPPP